MKKLCTLLPFVRCILLLIGFLTSIALQAQTTYSEGSDFPATSGATTYTFTQAGDYTFSGTVQTPNDQQDAFKVIIPTGFKITQAVLKASGGASQQQPTGFVSFADGYSGHSAATFSNSSGVNTTQTGDLGPNSASNPYIGLTSVDYSVGTSWSIKITVVSTGTIPTCTNPTVPTISATRTAICAGSSTILSVQSGSLNDATNWQWYSGSCGGTPAGSGSSIQVSPSSTTTYYVRGEGGCVSPGACASQQITVSAPFSVNLSNNGPLTCAKTGVTLTTTGGPTGASYTYNGSAQASSASNVTASVSQAGPYSVTVTVPGGCSATATTIVSSNTVAPSVSISPTSQTLCQGQIASFMASGANTYQWSSGQTTPTISVSVAGPYSVTGVAANGCSGMATATLSVNPLPAAPQVTNTTYCQNQPGQPLSATASPGASLRYYTSGSGGTGYSSIIPSTATPSVTTYYVSQLSNGCESMRAPLIVTVNPLPSAPTLVTASGYPYSAGVSSLTLSQNVGPVSLMASGCSGGMLTANGNAASSFTVSTAMTGTQTYTATCTQNGCTGPAASFQLTVVAPTLSVLHRDADYGNLTNNIIKPYLELANAGGSAIPYGELTVRYWFTAEGNAPPTNLAVYYAQLGAVNMNYVALSQPRQGATGYVEYSFPGGGSLGGGGNSGPIENGIQKTDGSNFDESDDYSYQANYQDYVPNMHITAYRNGVIVYGQEPTAVASQTAVQVYSQAKDGPTTSQIQTRLELRNTGNVALPVANLKLRYYFTSDNGQLANVYVDYADMGASNVAAKVVKLASPVNGADSYVELSFPGNPMQLNALSSLGAIDFRLVRSDYGLFDQTNDYSYAATYGNVGLNNHVTAYLNNNLVFGTPPSGAPARMIAQEAPSVLQARVLGNPVVGSSAEVEIRGVSGQAVSVRLIDLQGRSIHEQRVEQAGETERVSLPLGSSRGPLLLKVNTDSQQQSLKLLRP